MTWRLYEIISFKRASMMGLVIFFQSRYRPVAGTKCLAFPRNVNYINEQEGTEYAPYRGTGAI